MSTDYSYRVISSDSITLQVNLTGITEGKTDISKLGMSIYAYNPNTAEVVFTGLLDFAQLKEFYGFLDQVSIIKNPSKVTSGKFIEASEDVAVLVKRIEELGDDALRSVLELFKSDEKIQKLLTILTDAELDSITASRKYNYYKKEYSNLEQLLQLEMDGDITKDIHKYDHLKIYSAGQPEKIFQKWIEANLWVFGIEYAKKHDARKIALFSEADILMESLDGYLDLIELKRPKLDYEIFKFDKSHKCYYPSPALSSVIGQSLFYLQKLDDYKLMIEKEYKAKIIRPRVKIVIGRTNTFNSDQYDSLRMLNANLNHIQILSYDYLLSSAAKILSQFEEAVDDFEPTGEPVPQILGKVSIDQIAEPVISASNEV
ncbi:hypothetical protein D3C73_19490 [compost metagenome]